MTAGSEPVYGPTVAAGTVPAGPDAETLHAATQPDAAGTRPAHGEPLHGRDLDDGPTTGTPAGTLPDTADREPLYVHERAAGTVTTTVRAQHAGQHTGRDAGARIDWSRVPMPTAPRGGIRFPAPSGRPSLPTPAAEPLAQVTGQPDPTSDHEPQHGPALSGRIVTGPTIGPAVTITGTPDGPTITRIPAPGAERRAAHAHTVARLLDGTAPTTVAGIPVHMLELADGTTYRHEAGHWHPITNSRPPMPSTERDDPRSATEQDHDHERAHDVAPGRHLDDHPDDHPAACTCPPCQQWNADQWDRIRAAQQARQTPARPTSAPTSAHQDPTGPSTPGPAGQDRTAQHSRRDGPQHGPGRPDPWDRNTYTVRREAALMAPAGPALSSFVDLADLDDASPDPLPDTPRTGQEPPPMPRLAPAVLDAIRNAHATALADVDATRGAITRAEVHLRAAQAGHDEATTREAQLAAALAEHVTALAALDADRCPSCHMPDGTHTGGCAALTGQLDQYAAERRARLATRQA